MDQLSDMVRARAIVVRDQHQNNRTCPECWSGGCPVLAIWQPVIVQIEAERAGRTSLQ